MTTCPTSPVEPCTSNEFTSKLRILLVKAEVVSVVLSTNVFWFDLTVKLFGAITDLVNITGMYTKYK
jgi:hypothetical protein